jgi:hypothetical protein
LALWTGKTPRQAACLKLNFKKWAQHAAGFFFNILALALAAHFD